MVTIVDVAKYAGVSIATVSRVINNNGNVKQETVEKVRKAISELNYVPNEVGQMLKGSSSTKNIFVISSFAILESALIDALSVYTAANHLNIIILSSFQKNYINSFPFLLKNAYGVVCINAELFSPDIIRKIVSMVPTVFYGSVNNPALSNTYSDVFDEIDIVPDPHYQLNYQMAGFLFSKGISSLAYPVIHDTRSPDIAPNSLDRIRGIQDAAKDAGFDPVNLISIDIFGLAKESIDDRGISLGRSIAENILELPEMPGSILFNPVFSAIGCIKALHEHGINVPDDILMAAIDGDDIADVYIPSITTFHQPFDALAKRIIDILIARNERKPIGNADDAEYTIIPRESTQQG